MFFEAKLKYMYVTEEGKDKKKTSTFLLDAESYTEAESKLVTIAKTITNSDYTISSIRKTNYENVYLPDAGHSNDDSRYFAATVTYVDEESGKKKSFNSHYLVLEDSPEQVEAVLKTINQAWLVEWRVSSIKETKIEEVYLYEEDKTSPNVEV